MQSIKLTNEEIQILQELITYGAVNDANIFVADDLIITDQQAQNKIEKLKKNLVNLIQRKKASHVF